VAALLALLPAFLVAAAFAGPEFQVNTYTSTAQANASVAMANDRSFVVVWGSVFQDGSGNGVFGQRFDATATPAGSEFLVNTLTEDNQLNPKVAMDDDGDFVVAWHGNSSYGTYGVFAQRFGSSGSPLGSEFRVNTYTPQIQYHPSVALDADGDFVIVWASYQDTLGPPSGFGVFGQRFASSGAALGTEFQVNVYKTNQQTRPSVAADADGDFVVTWRSVTQDGQASYKGVFARRFSSSGVALASEFQVNTYTPFDQEYPSVAMDDDGDFLIAWQSRQDGSSQGVFGQRYASSGSRVGGELQINVWITSDQRFPKVAVDATGHFLASWQSREGQDGDEGGTFARRLSLGGEFQVNTYTTGYQIAPAVAMNAGGDLVVVWQSEFQDGGGEYGIFGRRFTAPPLPDIDIDGDGESQPLTDGILVLRYYLGFTGAALVSGAVDLQHCTRCNSASVQAYIASIALNLDIDGDGETKSLTDAILVLRFLFGFTGPSLIAGAVDDDCTRCSAASIESYFTDFVD
jgi:hypothetical protein